MRFGSTTHRSNHPRCLLGCAVLLACLVAGGCVQRRMAIRSNPPGALVYVDDYEVGTTPMETSFTYYGKRKIRLVKDGYETLTVMQDIPPPWYEITPIDFFSENVVPGELRDKRVLEYQMTPQLVTPPEQLLSRAEGLRRGVHSAATAAPGAAAGAPGVPPGAPRYGSGVPAASTPSYGAVAPSPGGTTGYGVGPGVGGQQIGPLPPR